MKKLFIVLLLFAGLGFSQTFNIDYEEFFKRPLAASNVLPAYETGKYLTNDGSTLSWGTVSFAGYLRASGVDPLTADWPMGVFNLTQAGWHGQTITADHGGTGFSSYAVGDILYADSTVTLAKRAAVAAGQVLASVGVNMPSAFTASPTLTGTVTANNLTTEPTLGLTLLTNGNFTADPTGTATPWMEGTSTNIGTAWVYASGVLRHATASTTTLRQVISATTGQLLKVMFTIAQDGATPIAGTIRVTVGGTATDGISDIITVAAGTYTRWLYATGTSTYYVTFTPSTTLAATIDDISVRVVTNGVMTSAGINSTGQILGVMGSITSPSFGFTQDSSTGFYAIGSSSAGVSLGGFKRFTFGQVTSGCDSNNFYIGGLTGAILTSLTATLQLGLSSATPINQTFKGPDATAGTADTAGGSVTVSPGNSTGSNNGTGYLNSPAIGAPLATTVNTTAVRASWGERGLTTYAGFNVNLIADSAVQMGQIVMADASADDRFDINGGAGTLAIGVLRGVGPSVQGTAYDIATGGKAYVAMLEDIAATRGQVLYQSATAGFANTNAALQAAGLNIGIAQYSEALFTFNGNTGVSATTITLDSAPEWAVNDPVIYWQSGDATVPTGLTTGTVYWVQAITTTALKISATRGGAALTFTANSGSGTTMYFQRLPLAMINIR